jgi:eukaryotic-like serine/threonine-protein kinase
MIDKTLGHYQITSRLGKGGMGEVYQAKDQKLGRDVAIKVLPEEFARDADRVARFQREAKLLASLNHPNIAAIHGLEESGGTTFLVLELVEGQTLAQKLNKRPLPPEEALDICCQIADALEAAHDRGIIHRDLKPANVMITPEDKVKVLDFGLGKALSEETQKTDSSKSPTITEAMTQSGVILGTAAYMSPEQAKGKAVDKRADIWALGCILYECLVGKRAFEGGTVSETLAAILKDEPQWQELPSNVPPNVRFVLHRCLEKDISRRFRDAADVRIQIEEVPSFVEPVAGIPRASHSSKIWIASVAILAVAAAICLIYIFRRAPAAQPMRFSVGMPPNISLAVGENSRGCAVISPDGTQLVFTGTDATTGKQSLYVRPIDSVEARPLEGTEEASSPFWSPDSRSIAFFAHGKLQRVELKGGPPQVICNVSTSLGAGAWNKNNIIVASLNDRGPLSKVSANSGVPKPVTSLKEPEELNHSWPQFLPDGNHFLYFSSGDIAGHNEVRVGSLDSPSAKPVLKGAADPAVYAHPGQLLFIRDRKLWAQPFDTKNLELAGSPVNLAERAITPVSVSENGTVIYRNDTKVPARFLWVDWDGKEIGPAFRPGYYDDPALSPDGSKLAFAGRESADSTMDVWILEFAGGALRRFTSNPANDRAPVWSPDGRSIVFWSLRQSGPGLYRKDSSGVGGEELIVPNKNEVWPYQWSPDGRYLLYMEIIRETLASDAWMFSFADRKSIPLLNTPIPEVDPTVSPDGRWMIYQTNESGRYEIYLTTFPPSSTKLSVVSDNGGDALWSSDGKELFYVNTTTLELWSLDVKAGNPPEFSGRRRIHAGPLFWWSAHSFDIDTARRRVLVQVSSAPQSDITALLHWTALLKQ